MPKIPTLGLDNKLLEKFLPNRLSSSELSATFVPGVHVYADATHGIGSGDDTAFLNAAYARLAPGLGVDTVIIHDGTWMIDGVNEAATTFDIGCNTGLQPVSGSTTLMTPGCKLKIIPNSSPFWSCIYIGTGKTNITVRGGQIEGDRLTHTFTADPVYPTHEFGYGVQIRAASNILIENMSIYGCTGDSVLVRSNGRITDGNYVPAKQVTIRNCTLDNARRNNISSTGSENLLIENNIISNAGQPDANHDGTAPRFGIDLEPSSSYQTVTYTTIQGNRFLNNMAMSASSFKGQRCLIQGNFSDAPFSIGWGTENVITGNVIYNPTDTTRAAIQSLDDATATAANLSSRAVVSNNSITGFDIGISGQRSMVVSGNYVSGFSSTGISMYLGLDTDLIGNHVVDANPVTPGNLTRGVYIWGGTRVNIRSNTFRNVQTVAEVHPISGVGDAVFAENDVSKAKLGVYIRSGATVTVKDNRFNLPGHADGESYAVSTQTNGDALVEGNVFRNCGANAINLINNGTAASRIVGNTFLDVKTTAIYASQGKHRIHRNTIVGTLASGTLGPAIQILDSATGSVVDNTVAHAGAVLFTYAVDAFAASNVFVGGNKITDGVPVLRPSGTEKFPAPDPKRVVSVTDTATLSVDSNNYDVALVTALAQALTVANPTGSPTAAQGLVFRFKDNGTARALSWGSQFRAIGVTLPTTTVASKTLYVGCMRNAIDSKWDVIAVAQEV